MRNLHMTKEEENNLKDWLVESIALQYSHEYETDEEFEEMFGTLDTLEEVIDILCAVKCIDDIENLYYPECVDASPEDQEYFKELFSIGM